MGWGAHLSTSGRLVRLCLVFAVAGLAGGCFQPVYGDRSVSGGPGVREALKGVEIPIITAPANSPTAPIAVQLRNDLIFNFTGGGTPTSPTHRLAIQLVGTQSTVAVDNTGFSADRELPSDRDLYPDRDCDQQDRHGGIRPRPPPATTAPRQQRFARVSASQDAGRRATKEISDQITTRIAAYFVTGT